MSLATAELFLKKQEEKKQVPAFEKYRKEMGAKYLRKEESKRVVKEILLIYENNGKIYEYNGNEDIIFNTNCKLCLYSGQLDETNAPHGHGILISGDKTLTGKFYHGLLIDSGAILETKDYTAMAIVMGYEVLSYSHIRYKKINL